MTLLSIIVPVYNVKAYIRPCFESIFHQGLDDSCYEVIIIDDDSKDNSMEVIQDFISIHSNIIVVHQENQGLSVVRNNGIALAKGEYIFMPDSDDLLIYNSLPFLLEKALTSKADLIVADFMEMLTYDVDELQMDTIKQKDGTFKEKTGEQLLLEDLSPYECYVWRTLFRKEFIINNHISFYPGILYQDVPFTHECYIKAQRCLRVNWLLNIYRRRPGSATATFSLKKAKDFCITIGKTWELTHLDGLSPRVLQKIENDVYTSCSIMLWSASHTAKNASEREYVIDILKETVPDLHFRFGFKHRITSFLLEQMPHTFAHIRFFYDIIIEDKILPFYRHKVKTLFKH